MPNKKNSNAAFTPQRTTGIYADLSKSTKPENTEVTPKTFGVTSVYLR
jgi:hypothetical protein